MKVAEPPATYCVSCHSSGVGKTCIDFEAYYDGPVIDEGTYKYQVDDLIICEECLTQAAHKLGLGNIQTLIDENKELGEAFNIKLEEIQELHGIINGLRQSVDGLSDQKIVAPLTPKPSGGRQPKIVDKVK